MLKNTIKSCLPIEVIALKRFIGDLRKNGLIKKRNKKSQIYKRVVFIMQFPETWTSCKSVYDAFVKRGTEVYILCIPKFAMNHIEKLSEPIGDRENEAYKYFIQAGYHNCIRADQEDSTWYKLENIDPDIAIYTRPYNSHYPACYRTNQLRDCLTCYIPYGYSVLKGSVLNGMFNYDFIRNIDKCFVCNKSSLDYLKRYLVWYRVFGKLDLKYLGYPRFDLIKRRQDHNCIKTITWLPRWIAGKATEEQKGSHFLEYREQFMKYVERHPEIYFIIRPHPLMFSNFIDNGVMSVDEVAVFKNNCERISNITLDTSADYLPLLENTDVLITDVTALMVEFFYANVPIIYCDDTTNFSDEALQMTEAMYKAQDWDQIVTCIEEIVNNGDRFNKWREEYLHKGANSNSKVGDAIVDSLLAY